MPVRSGLRQSLGLVHSVLRLARLDWRVLDFGTVSRRQRDLKVQLPCQRRTTALDLLVDSTGIKQAQKARGRIPAPTVAVTAMA